MNLLLNYFDFLSEVESKIKAHADEIGMCFFHGKKPTKIDEYDNSLADRHNDGRMTMKLTTDAGMLMYKPHPLKTDIVAVRLFETYFDDIVKVPKSLDFGDYGFSEYIENNPADTIEDAKKYFYNIGGIAAIARAIGMEDLIMENFLAEKKLPVFVDSEFLLSPERPMGIMSRDLESSFEKQARRLFDNTSLFGLIDDTKPIGLLNYCEKENLGLPVIDGVRQNTYDYVYEICRGYDDIYDRCLKNRDEILNILYGIKGAHVRVFVRGTAYYHKMSQIAKDPRVKDNEEIKTRIFGKMADFYKNAGITGYEKLIEKEQESIFKDDIPFFWTEPTSRNLYFGDECIFENFFEMSMLENAKARLTSLCEEDKSFSIKILEKNLNSLAYEIKNEPIKLNTSAEPIDQAQAAQQAYELFAKISEEMITAPDGSKGLLSVRYASARLEPCDATIGFGMLGPAVFAAAIKKTMPEHSDKADEIINAACDAIDAYIKGLESTGSGKERLTSIGYFSGAAGILEGLLLIKKLAPSERANELYVQFFDHIDRFVLEEVTEPGIYNGLSGFILSLCDERNEITDLANIKRASNLLVNLLDSGNYKLLSGYGNGISGIGASLLAAYRVTKEERYFEEARKLFDKEHELYKEELLTWPDLRHGDETKYMHGICSGAPGIAIAMITAKQYGIETAEADLQRAVNAMKNIRLLYTDRLCCGNASSAEALITVGEYKVAAKLLGMMRERFLRTGEMMLGSPDIKNIFIPGLMFGYAGIGYAFLHFAYPDLIPGLFDFQSNCQKSDNN